MREAAVPDGVTRRVGGIRDPCETSTPYGSGADIHPRERKIITSPGDSMPGSPSSSSI